MPVKPNLLHPSPDVVLSNARGQYLYFEMYDGKSIRKVLEDYVKLGFIDEEEAHLAVINGTKVWALAVILNVEYGYGHFTLAFDEKRNFRNELEKLVKMGYIDQEDAHIAMMKGNKRNATKKSL